MTETQALLHLDPTYATHGNSETVVKRMWAIIDAYNSQAATVDSGALVPIVAALHQQIEGLNGAVHERIARECWKMHHDDFNVCQEPACVFLKAVAQAVGWTVEVSGVRDRDQRPPQEPSAESPEGQNT